MCACISALCIPHMVCPWKGMVFQFPDFAAHSRACCRGLHDGEGEFSAADYLFLHVSLLIIGTPQKENTVCPGAANYIPGIFCPDKARYTDNCIWKLDVVERRKAKGKNDER